MILTSDCVEAMRGMPESSVDAIVTDPPYGLEFMGKEWDRLGASIEPTTTSAGGVGAYAAARVRYGAAFQQMQEWHEAWATEALRVLKPGGHLLAFGGTRTYHRLTCAIEDAGFEIRDCLVWLYGSGFPKSLDVGKAIDKAAGVEREVVGFSQQQQQQRTPGINTAAYGDYNGQTGDITAPATPEAQQWDGWGTALKPAHEPIVLARKPLTGTVAGNVLEHGTGALNVDGCRVEGAKTPAPLRRVNSQPWFTTADEQNLGGNDALGRWPPNVLLDETSAAMLDEQSGEAGGGGSMFAGNRQQGASLDLGISNRVPTVYGDSGGASRFFYVAKASRRERNAGLEGFAEEKPHDRAGHVHADGRAWDIPGSHSTARANHHPTVKPIALMRWLVRLVTPPEGTVLDPFTGSGTTGIAAILEGFHFTGIERDPDYAAIAEARCAFWEEHGEAAYERLMAEERAEAERTGLAEMGQGSLFDG